MASSWASSLNLRFEKPELWNMEGPTKSVTSFLSLCLDNTGLYSGLNLGPISTGQCGLGWTYVVKAVAPPYEYRNTPSTCITISIATHPIRTGDKDYKLPVSITPVNSGNTNHRLEFVKQHAKEIRLPAAETFSLATYCYLPEFSQVGVAIPVATNLSPSITFEIRVEFPPTWTLDPNEKYQQNVRSAMMSSLEDGMFSDTIFCLFTRRVKAARAGHDTLGWDLAGPQTLFANGTLLRGFNSMPLNKLLQDENKKVTAGDLQRKPCYVHCDYSSDSDLEDEDESDKKDDGPVTTLVHVESEEEANEADTWEFTSNITSSSEEGNDVPLSESPRLNLKGGQSAVLITDFAFQTWKAFIHYIHSGGAELHFNDLRSENPPEFRVKKTKDESHPLSCSPKSMYRLAIEFKSEELKGSSLRAIIQHLSKKNIIEELFSHFTSMHPEVQRAEIEALVPFLDDPVFVEELLGRISSATADKRMQHSGITIAAITKRIIGLANKEPEVRPCDVCAERAAAAAKAEEDRARNEAEEKKKAEAKDKTNKSGKNPTQQPSRSSPYGQISLV
ncbi:hypothetical protein H0H92_005056 [Tricholoma furcatifolium]|nr:hypothetical protein H0H92_005056 [Tricholoma furcatifolium]